MLFLCPDLHVTSSPMAALNQHPDPPNTFAEVGSTQWGGI